MKTIMKKKIVRLNESQLRGMISESVRKTINEISADLAHNAARKSDVQVDAIDEVRFMCDELLEKINDVFFEGQDDLTTSLSPKIAQDLNLDEFKRVVKNFSSRLQGIGRRKLQQSQDLHDFAYDRFKELPDD